MRRVILVLGTILFVYFGGRAALRGLASDETKIRWKIEQMFEGYNTGRAGLGVAHLHKNWRHEAYELDRELLRGALIRASMQDRDRETKELTSRVELLEDSLVISVAEAQANIELRAAFSRRRDGEWTEGWRIRVEADLEKGDEGWQIVTSRHDDLEGTQLSR